MICFMATETKAQKPEELLAKANTLYNESAYDSAAVVYESIINKGYSSATLFYNLGNTYYKIGNYPLAIYYYEKSLKLDPKNEDTKHNIEIAQAFISDKIESVKYPGLETDPDYELGKKYLKGASGVISIVIKGGKEAAMRFMDACQLAAIVVHVADSRTCVLHPASTTHRQLSDQQLVDAGVGPDLVRMSVGVEHIDDIITDIEQALAAV